MSPRAALGVLALLVALIPSWISMNVWAQPAATKVAEAKRLYRAGARAYDAGQFDFAVNAFDKAFALVPRPALRFSAAQALRKQYVIDANRTSLVRAKAYYQYYLREAPEGKRRLEATKALEKVKSVLEKTKPTAPGSAAGGGDSAAGGGAAVPPPPATTDKPALGKMQIDGTVKGARATVQGHVKDKPLPAFLRLPAGVYRVTIEAPGYITDSRQVVLEAGDIAVVSPRLIEKPATVTISGGDGADVVIDGRFIGRIPMAKPIELPAGQHSIAIGTSGHDPLVQKVNLSRGEKLAIDADLATSTQRYLAWSFFGAAALMTGAGITLSLIRSSRETEAQEILDASQLRALTRQEAENYNKRVGTVNTLNNLAGISYGLAVASAGVGLMLYFIDNPNLYAAGADSDEDEADLKATAVNVNGGGMLMLRGSF